jgi:hypothetical protein
MTTRRTLPQRRRAESFALTACNQQLTIKLGFHPDNSLGVIFVGVGKTGNDIQSIALDAGVLNPSQERPS